MLQPAFGSKLRCMRSMPTEMQSMSENDFECFASTGVNAPGTMSPNLVRGEGQFPPSRLLDRVDANCPITSESPVTRPRSAPGFGRSFILAQREPMESARTTRTVGECATQPLVPPESNTLRLPFPFSGGPQQSELSGPSHTSICGDCFLPTHGLRSDS